MKIKRKEGGTKNKSWCCRVIAFVLVMFLFVVFVIVVVVVFVLFCLFVCF